MIWQMKVGMPILAQTRGILILAFKALPLLLISFIGFLAIGLGNLSLFLLFIGHATLVPLATELLHLVFNKSGSLITSNDISQLVPIIPTSGASYNAPVNVMPTYWMAHISFFFGYILTNAVSIYTLPPQKQAADWMIISRQTRAATLIGASVISFLTLSALRFYLTGSETVAGILLATTVLGGLGAFWYYIASLCGARNSDIFGVAQQMMSKDSSQDKPMTCVYKPR